MPSRFALVAFLYKRGFMANPQKENGYTAIANEILERLYAIPLSGSEYKIILCILRKTYGWRKKSDRISLSQLVTETKLSRKQVCESINKLVTKRLLFKLKTSQINEYYFNKDYEMWLVTERLMGSYRNVTSSRAQASYRNVTYKRNKENIQKKGNNFSEEKKKLISKMDIEEIWH